MEEKEFGKESENTHSLYNFLVDDWLKTLLENDVKEKVEKLAMEDHDEKGGDLEKKEGN